MAMYDTYIMRRTQIYLEEEQHERLAKWAAEEGTTTSELIRRAIDRWFDNPDSEAARLARFKAAVDRVAGHAPYLPDGATYVQALRRADLRRQEELERRQPG
jgi:hypothetical protein